jgi:photosystem II stability/assembly factor-like uncharacterized protein
MLLAACGGGGGGEDGGDTSRTNPPPAVTGATLSPNEPWINGTITFQAGCAGAAQPTYEWDFGDGTGTGPMVEGEVSKIYSTSGDKTVSVTCVDGSSNLRSTAAQVRFTVGAVDLNAVANRTCATGRQGRGWCTQNPLPTAANLRDIAVVNSVIFWAVGDNGTILKSTNAGATWKVQNPKISENLNAIAAWDTNTAWAVSDRGKILRTRDGGATWEATQSELYLLEAIVATDANTLWAVGPGVLKTTDGGSTWTRQTSGIATLLQLSLGSIAAVDANTAWAVGTRSTNPYWGNVVLRTTDGGATWEWHDLVGTGGSVFGSAMTIAASDADNAWIAEIVSQTGTIHKVTKTQSGIAREVQRQNTVPLHAIRARRTGDVWAVGDQGAVLRASNGVNWSELRSPATTLATLKSVVAADANTALVVGDAGTVLRTTSAGGSWTELPSNRGFTGRLNAIAAVDRQTAWAVGAGETILKTLNGGASWEIKRTGGSNELKGIAAYNANIAWAVGTGGTILKTVDGGEIWSAQTSGTTRTLYAVATFDATIAWAVGGDETVLKTSNGGSSWTTLYSNPSRGAASFSILLLDAGTALMTWGNSVAGKIYRVRDDASPPVEVWSEPTWKIGNMYTITKLIGNTAWASGDNGILRSTDGGQSWQEQTYWANQGPPYEAHPLTVAAVDQATLWLAGSNLIMKSVDGGVTWTSQAAGATGMTAMLAPDRDTAWAVGRNGLILKTLTGGE